MATHILINDSGVPITFSGNLNSSTENYETSAFSLKTKDVWINIQFEKVNDMIEFCEKHNFEYTDDRKKQTTKTERNSHE